MTNLCFFATAKKEATNRQQTYDECMEQCYDCMDNESDFDPICEGVCGCDGERSGMGTASISPLKLTRDLSTILLSLMITVTFLGEV